MKRMMFSDRFGLTKAVLEGRKTVTRRSVSKRVLERAEAYRQEYFEDTLDALSEQEALLELSPYKVGDVVTVAQSYGDVYNQNIAKDYRYSAIRSTYVYTPGWTNKMYVKPDLMPHRIRITGVRVERLQDITNEDCLLEGIYNWKDAPDCPQAPLLDKMDLFGFDGRWDAFRTPREAFADLIDRMSGKGTWNKNPYVFVYEFQLIK